MNLDDAAIDGLDAAQRERLAQAGIRTLEDLTRCDAMRISSGADIALTRVLHLQLLGRRALAGARGATSATGSDIELTEHGILTPARPLPGARSRPAAAQIAPQPVVDLANALTSEVSELTRADSGTAARFSPAEVPLFDEPARPELDLRERTAPRDAGPSGGAALDSAGPFA